MCHSPWGNTYCRHISLWQWRVPGVTRVAECLVESAQPAVVDGQRPVHSCGWPGSTADPERSAAGPLKHKQPIVWVISPREEGGSDTWAMWPHSQHTGITVLLLYVTTTIVQLLYHHGRRRQKITLNNVWYCNNTTAKTGTVWFKKVCLVAVSNIKHLLISS